MFAELSSSAIKSDLYTYTKHVRSYLCAHTPMPVIHSNTRYRMYGIQGDTMQESTRTRENLWYENTSLHVKVWRSLSCLLCHPRRYSNRIRVLGDHLLWISSRNLAGLLSRGANRYVKLNVRFAVFDRSLLRTFIFTSAVDLLNKRRTGVCSVIFRVISIFVPIWYWMVLCTNGIVLNRDFQRSRLYF